MEKTAIISKIAEIDAQLSIDLYNRKFTAEQRRKLRDKRDRLEKKLYKAV